MFGLKTFMMKHTIPSMLQPILIDTPEDSWREKPSRASLAYLVLPCMNHTAELSEADSYNNDYEPYVNSKMGLHDSIDVGTLQITHEQKQRFQKSMQFLDLKPKLYRFQVLGESDENGPIVTRKQRFSGVVASNVKAVGARLNDKVKGKLHVMILSIGSNYHSYSWCMECHADLAVERENSRWPQLMSLVSVTSELYVLLPPLLLKVADPPVPVIVTDFHVKPLLIATTGHELVLSLKNSEPNGRTIE